MAYRVCACRAPSVVDGATIPTYARFLGPDGSAGLRNELINLRENFREFWRKRAEEEHRAATTEMGQILARRDMEGYPPYLEDEIRQSWREAQLLNGWVKGKYMCFGFPRHDRSAIERVKIH